MKIIMDNGHVHDFGEYEHSSDATPYQNEGSNGRRLNYQVVGFAENEEATMEPRSNKNIYLVWSAYECSELWKHFILGAYGDEALMKVMDLLLREGYETLEARSEPI